MHAGVYICQELECEAFSVWKGDFFYIKCGIFSVWLWDIEKKTLKIFHIPFFLYSCGAFLNLFHQHWYKCLDKIHWWDGRYWSFLFPSQTDSATSNSAFWLEKQDGEGEGASQSMNLCILSFIDPFLHPQCTFFHYLFLITVSPVQHLIPFLLLLFPADHQLKSSSLSMYERSRDLSKMAAMHRLVKSEKPDIFS